MLALTSCLAHVNQLPCSRGLLWPPRGVKDGERPGSRRTVAGSGDRASTSRYPLVSVLSIVSGASLGAQVKTYFSNLYSSSFFRWASLDEIA
jgi:hypothetical protein